MKDFLITSAALTAAIIVVASTRLIIPAMGLIYEYILASFEPIEPEPQLALAPAVAAAVVLTPEPQTVETVATPAQPRTTQKRRASTKTTARKTEVAG